MTPQQVYEKLQESSEGLTLEFATMQEAFSAYSNIYAFKSRADAQFLSTGLATPETLGFLSRKILPTKTGEVYLRLCIIESKLRPNYKIVDNSVFEELLIKDESQT